MIIRECGRAPCNPIAIIVVWRNNYGKCVFCCGNILNASFLLLVALFAMAYGTLPRCNVRSILKASRNGYISITYNGISKISTKRIDPTESCPTPWRREWAKKFYCLLALLLARLLLLSRSRVVMSSCGKRSALTVPKPPGKS